ncbi:MAG: hypothetical protein R2705_07650 [Ilumatobacteraceae bacterium]
MANEARYFKNKYDHVFVEPAAEAPLEVVEYVHRIIETERDSPSPPARSRCRRSMSSS